MLILDIDRKQILSNLSYVDNPNKKFKMLLYFLIGLKVLGVKIKIYEVFYLKTYLSPNKFLAPIISTHFSYNQRGRGQCTVNYTGPKSLIDMLLYWLAKNFCYSY